MKVRDAILRSFPEVWQVVGKAGRAETATDPSPLDMVETVINLRDHELWPKRKLKFEDALAQTGAVLTALEARGILRSDPSSDRRTLLNEAAMEVETRVDVALRDLAMLRLAEFRPELGRALVGDALDDLLGRLDRRDVVRPLTADERTALVESLAATHGDHLALEPLFDDVSALVHDAVPRLVKVGALRDRLDLLDPTPTPLEQAGEAVGNVLGARPSNLFTRVTDHLIAAHEKRLRERTIHLNWELFDRTVGAATWAAIEELNRLGRERKLAAREATSEELQSLRSALEKPFSDKLLLWQKTKDDLVAEMGTALQMPGWGNIFTQPIINRIEMLSTGVRSPIGVKVFGANLDQIQQVSQEISTVLRGIRGASNVVPDQVVGKGYIDIQIDRKKAARYGIQIGDIQDVVEVAMGGKPLTMTVEGRERYPVRVRYARAFRDDLESLKRILVSARARWLTQGRAWGAPLEWARAPRPRHRALLHRSRFPWPRWPMCGSLKAPP